MLDSFYTPHKTSWRITREELLSKDTSKIIPYIYKKDFAKAWFTFLNNAVFKTLMSIAKDMNISLDALLEEIICGSVCMDLYYTKREIISSVKVVKMSRELREHYKEACLSEGIQEGFLDEKYFIRTYIYGNIINGFQELYPDRGVITLSCGIVKIKWFSRPQVIPPHKVLNS